jgi:chemotaxis protein MotB
MPDMMSAPPPPSLQPLSSLARQAAQLDKSEFETEAIPVARLRRLRRNRRLGWLMTGLLVAGLSATVAIGLEERQRLMGDLKSAKLSRIETEHAQASLVRQLQTHDDAMAAVRASLAQREAELNARATTSPESLSLVERLRKELDKKESDIEVAGNSILVNVIDKALFSSGKADLSSGGERTLAAIAIVLKEAPGRRIVVDGHTDDKRPSSKAFASNWELSALRAVGVVRFLVEDTGLDPAQISAQAHAQFQPRSKRSEKNRRIEFRLEPTEPTAQPNAK